MPIATLACAHIFHRECIRPWFNQKGTCPTCRANIGAVADLVPIFQAATGDVVVEVRNPPQRQITNITPRNAIIISAVAGVVIFGLIIGGLFLWAKLNN